MRLALVVMTVAVAVSCGGDKTVRYGQQDPVAAPVKSVEEERAADESAYRFVYLPVQRALMVTHPGEWLAVAGGRVIPMSGAEPAPVPTMEQADAAARTAAPNARHRYVFQIGEDGDVTWQLGGCELPHVVGNQLLALLEKAGVEMRNIGPGERMNVRVNGQPAELTVATPDEMRMYLRPQIGPPGAAGAAKENFCVATGFAGTATMSAATAAGLELWEIPGTVRVTGAVQSGECRRARARLAWANTPLDFTVAVAVWGK